MSKVNVESSADLLAGMNMGSYLSNTMTLDLRDMRYKEYPFNINKYYRSVPLMNSRKTPEFYKGFDKSSTCLLYTSDAADE